MTYQTQTAWRAISQFMPQDYRIPADFEPAEEWWQWLGHRVHLDCYRNPEAKAKVILFHGVGTNGRQMNMVLGHFLARQGYEIIAIDMPTYGLTEVADGSTVLYDDWIRLGSDYINHELAKDARPIFLYGLSAGGMETYDVAALNGKVKGIIGMTFLDHSRQAVRDATTRNLFMSRVATPLMPLALKLGLGRLRLPMSWASKMSALCNHQGAMRAFMQDKTSAGNRASIAFLNSYMHHQAVVEPEDFAVCPILLTQPAADHWTPLELSEPFLKRIQKVPVTVVMLPDGGHYPLEESALKALREAALAFIEQQLAA